MPIRFRAEKTDSGTLLSGIASRADADRLCAYFCERDTAAIIPPLCSPGNFRAFLVSTTMERFAELIRESKIKLTS